MHLCQVISKANRDLNTLIGQALVQSNGQKLFPVAANDIKFLSSPFSFEAFKLLEGLGATSFKLHQAKLLIFL